MTSQRTEFQNCFYKCKYFIHPSSISASYCTQGSAGAHLSCIQGLKAGLHPGHFIQKGSRPGDRTCNLTVRRRHKPPHQHFVWKYGDFSYFRHVAVRLVIYHFARSFLSLVTYQQQSEENYHLIPIQFSPAGRFQTRQTV